MNCYWALGRPSRPVAVAGCYRSLHRCLCMVSLAWGWGGACRGPGVRVQGAPLSPQELRDELYGRPGPNESPAFCYDLVF